MRLTIDVPEQYADAVRYQLDRRGYAGTPQQVASVLRFCALDALEKHWWKKKGVRMLPFTTGEDS